MGSNNENGMSLVALLVVVALVGILATAVSSLGNYVIKSAKATALGNEKEMLRNLIRTRTDCAQTRARFVPHRNFYDRSGQPLLTTRPGHLEWNGWRVRVTAYSAATGAFTVSAMHEKELRPTYKPLFDPIPFVCK